jgi:hypothetical protein
MEDQFWFIGASFGIMAPPARKRTAFKENRGANAGTIMDGIATDVEKSTSDQDSARQSI